MCGIAGIVDYKNPPSPKDNVYKLMLDSMTNRGPDDEGMLFSDSCALLHKRLCVIDPVASIQPLSYYKNGKTYTIVYNGELYNTDEIRRSLTERGYSFKTKGDTEVVLAAYICFGEKCLDIFNGIFAFAIWDHSSDALFFARDPMGVKPFFYYHNGEEFIFASAIPTLLCHPHVPHSINSLSVSELILLGPGRTPSSAVFTYVKELPRGYCGSFTPTGLKIRQYFFLKDTPHADSFDTTVSTVRFLVEDAIKRQLVSDVPIGTFLSGGLDSSIISAVASSHMALQGKTLDTFSVTYKDNQKHFKASHFQPNSDESYIETMVKHIKSNHHSVVLDTDDIVSALYPVVDEKGLPGMADVDSSLLLFCKKIKNHVTVALSGECADEASLTC